MIQLIFFIIGTLVFTWVVGCVTCMIDNRYGCCGEDGRGAHDYEPDGFADWRCTKCGKLL